MRVTNSFFNAQGPVRSVFIMPQAKSIPGFPSTFAGFESARHVIKKSFAQPDWDGYGALPILEETKGNALAALNQLQVSTSAPEITQNPNGTLSFEWETNQGFGQLEIGLTRYSFCLQPHYGQPILDSGDASEVDPSIGVLLKALLYPEPSEPLSVILR